MNAVLNELAGAVSSASLCDAMSARHDHRCHLIDLVSPTPERVLFGPAATVQFLPMRRDRRRPAEHDFAAVVRAAAAGSPAGSVLVMASGGCPEAALAGGKKLTLVAALGMGGVLTDGRLRDFADVPGLGLAAYCRGQTVLADRSRLMPFAANVPVALEDVAVFPGDYVYADGAGAVVIPGAEVVAVLEAAVAREVADAAEARRIRAEAAAAGPLRSKESG